VAPPRQRHLARVAAPRFPTPQKAKAIGIWTAIASIGTAIGPTLGGVLVEHWGWRSFPGGAGGHRRGVLSLRHARIG
jgi:MFS family permease